MPGHDDPKCDFLRLVSSWLSNESNGSWLILLDNADDEKNLYGKPAQNESIIEGTNATKVHLASFLPQTPNGCVLITSRNKQLASDLVLGDDALVHVEIMDELSAMELMKTRVSVPVDEEAVCADLLHELDCLPLAIVQAAAHIQRRTPRVTISQ